MTLVEVVNHVLGDCGVPSCIIGELALNYYNVPRVIYGLEFCVSRSHITLAASNLCLSGYFEPCDPEPIVNNYTEYKRGFPRLRTTFLPGHQQTIIIFAADMYGLEPLKETTLQPPVTDGRRLSKEMDEFAPEEVAAMRMPRLAPFLAGLAARFLATRDDVAMIAVEELVDGMDLDERWAHDQLQDCEAAARALILQQIEGKPLRMDHFSENKVTCFVRDEDEAAHVKSIAGSV